MYQERCIGWYLSPLVLHLLLTNRMHISYYYDVLEIMVLIFNFYSSHLVTVISLEAKISTFAPLFFLFEKICFQVLTLTLSFSKTCLGHSVSL